MISYIIIISVAQSKELQVICNERCCPTAKASPNTTTKMLRVLLKKALAVTLT